MRTLIGGIFDIGLGKAFQAVVYALQRDILNRVPRTGGAPVSPGALQEALPLAGGAHFRFAHAGLEVIFLTRDLVRVSWEPGPLPIPYALARSKWLPPEATLHREARGWTLSCPGASVTVGDDGALHFCDANGRTLRQEQPPQRCDTEWVHRAYLHPEEHVYGLGERAVGFDLRGRTCQLWNRDPKGGYAPGTDPLYLGLPVYMVLNPMGACLVFYENPFSGVLTFDEKAEARFSGGALRYYLAVGTPAQVLERYSELTGRPPLPPRWALGYHQSHWGYRSEQEVREVAAGFGRHHLPISTIHLDIDHLDGYRVFTVDTERFPDLAGLARDLEEQGIRLVTIVDCGVKRDPGFALFREGLERAAFCTLPDGRPVYAPVWPGWCAFPDFTAPEARSWWGEQYRWSIGHGIAGFWHDMNEPTAMAAWGDLTLPLSTRHALDGRSGDHREAHNLYGLLMARAGYEGLHQLRPERRPWILSRSGWAGLQRYAWNWTGDSASTWEALRATLPTVLGLGLSGLPFSGPDIGGFSGTPSAELYLRWFQLATFLPFFRTHAALDRPRREPWVWGEPYLGILREFLRLRYRLMPYLYTLAWEASQTGAPLVRPLFWPDAADPDLWDVADAFFLGPALLVAPVLEEGATERTVALPHGRWYDFWNDEPLDGPGVVHRPGPLERIPLLVRAGTVLPLEEEGRLVLHAYPPTAGEDRSILYSDAGDGYGARRVDQFWLLRAGGRIELHWDAEGQYAFPYQEVDVQFHGLEAAEVRVNGQARGTALRFRVEPLCQVVVLPAGSS